MNQTRVQGEFVVCASVGLGECVCLSLKSSEYKHISCKVCAQPRRSLLIFI